MADFAEGRPGTTAAENAERLEACERIWLLGQGNEVLRRAATAAYLSQTNLAGEGPTHFEGACRRSIPLAVTCRVLKLARWPDYRGLTCPINDTEPIAAYPANALFDANHDDPAFDYRFLLDEAGDAGVPVFDRPAKGAWVTNRSSAS